MARAELKAAGVLSSLEAWRQTLSSAEWQSLLERLPADTRALVEQPPLPMTWIDFEHSTRIRTALREVVGETRAVELIERISCESVKRDFHTIYRALVRMATVEYVMRKAMAMYTTYVRNGGTVHLEMQGPKLIRVHYRGVPDVALENLARAVGTARGVIELTGKREVRCVRRQVMPPDDFDFDIAWS